MIMDRYYDIVGSLEPKLQWNVEKISSSGGDILLSTIHSVSNYHAAIFIHEPVGGIPHVVWSCDVMFEGTLEECKQFCSDKILNDFLKLCE